MHPIEATDPDDVVDERGAGEGPTGRGVDPRRLPSAPKVSAPRAVATRSATTRAVAFSSVVALCLLGSATVAALCWHLGVTLYLPVAWDVWFDADTVRVFDDVSQATSRHLRAPLHPFFGLLSHSLYRALAALFDLAPHVTVQLQLCCIGGATLLAFHWMLRCVGGGALDAWIFTGLFATSAAFLFFAAVPETFALGGMTTTASIAWLSCARDGRGGDAHRAGALVLAFSATASNAGGPAAWVLATRPRASIARVIVVGLGLIALLSIAQRSALPSARWWFAPLGDLADPAVRVRAGGVTGFVTSDLVPDRSFHGYLEVLRAFLAHATVMPEPGRAPRDSGTYFLTSGLPVLSVQTSRTAVIEPWGATALASWLPLLALGTWRTLATPRGHGARLVLAAAVVQLALHLVVGRETFLYSLHYQPLLVALAALACIESRGRVRSFARFAAIVALVACGVHNWRAFEAAVDAIGGHRVARAATPGVRLELGLVDVTGAHWLGRPDHTTVLSQHRTAGAVTTAVQRGPLGDARLALRVRADREAFGDPRPLVPAGTVLLIADRWVVALDSRASDFRVEAKGSVLCGDSASACAIAVLGRTGGWDVHFVDALGKPVWGGMGGLQRTRRSAAREGWQEPPDTLPIVTAASRVDPADRVARLGRTP